MFLKAVHIRHYKSLDDVRVEFAKPITVIVGPNAVGKSNFVDCLRFVRDAVATDLEHAVSKRGGMVRVRQFSRTRPFNVTVALDFEQDLGEDHARKNATYEFTLHSLSGGNYIVEQESAVYHQKVWHEIDDGKFMKSDVEEAGFSRNKAGQLTYSGETYDPPARPDQLTLGAGRGFDVLGEPIAEFIGGWNYSAIYPNTLRVLSTVDKDTSLSEEGGNWASVIKSLKRTQKGRAALDRVFEAVRSVIPSFQDVVVKTVGSYLVPHFRFDAEGQISEFDPVQLSDGTLRIFGILLALYQVPAPSLLVLEEPEQTVHPAVLGVLADALREVSETTQVVVTTHSPHFVDHFAPEEIRVATLANGLTRISPIKPSQVEAVKRQLISLEEFMLAEGLQPSDA